jgi:UDP-N-acetylmuramoylalanine--D-glutamate ligase
MDFKNKTVTIIGFSRSGQEAANLVNRFGAKIRISDNSSDPRLKSDFEKLNLNNALIELGSHSEDFISGSDLVVLSPGVSLNSEPAVWAKNKNISVISEIELAFQFCQAPIVAVTGTSGKTTVTTLIGEILKLTRKNVFVCGNIGAPFSKFVLDIKPADLVVLEVSSFQLETIKSFKPYVAVFLNISQNHLDRHADMAEYLTAKRRIFMNQDKKDFTVLNYADPIVRDFAREIKSKAVFFNCHEEKEIANPNFLAALAVGGIFRIKRDKCLKVLRDFKGVEHRLEFVRNIKGVDFINDSKATTIDAAAWALNNIKKPIIMIAGGRDKHVDFSIMIDLARKKIKEMILIGEAKAKLKKTFSGSVEIQETDTIKEAIKLAFSHAKEGDCVILCPMCASFDMFKDFEERGRIFKEIVQNL